MAESDKRLDLSAEQGATFRQTVNVSQSGSSAPQDLTGCSARMQIRSGYTSTSRLVATLSSTDNGITLGGSAGTITLFISASTMSSITVRSTGNTVPPAQAYFYDLVVTFPSGDVVRVFLGQFVVYAAVTQ